MEGSKDFKRGYKDANSVIKSKADAIKYLNQARAALTNDDFDKGWKTACKEHIK